MTAIDPERTAMNMRKVFVSILILVSLAASQSISQADDTMTHQPDFPVVSDFHQLDENWWMTFPTQFKKRFEDREVVFWRPGFTVWASVWKNDDDKSVADRFDWFRSRADTSAFDESIDADSSSLHYSYRLNENRETGIVYVLYGFVFKDHGHLQVAFYFDREGDLDMARSIFESIDEYGYSFVTNHITVDGRMVGYMYREEPDRPGDSGWRFFSGEETQNYVDDSENTKIRSVNTITKYDPSIVPYLNSPIGSAFGKQDGQFVPE
jgi:hypothetical protein